MILLDANVLVYALNADAPHHAVSRRVVDAAMDGVLDAVLVPQVLVEAYAILTDRRRVAHPLDAEVAWAQIEALRLSIRVLPVLESSLAVAGTLVAQHHRTGQDVFDLFLVAQMLAHGAPTVCTFDSRGFRGYAGIQALTPEDLVTRLP